MVLDPSSPITALRLRLGDTRDLQILPDEVYEQVLIEKSGNIKAATITCGQYILATLAFNSHEKMMGLEVWGSESFNNYSKYLASVVSNPDFSGISPIPYGLSGLPEITCFQKGWDSIYDCECYGYKVVV